MVLISEMEIDGCIVHSDHKAIKFKSSVDRRKSASANKTSALDIRANLRLLRELGSDVPWENASEDAGLFLSTTF